MAMAAVEGWAAAILPPIQLIFNKPQRQESQSFPQLGAKPILPEERN